MSLQTLPYVLVYIGAFVLSGLVFYYSWRNRTGPGMYAFVVAVLLGISWLTGYIFEINASTLQAKIFWDNFQYIGFSYIPVALLIFSLGFVGVKFNTRLWTIILGILPTVILVVVFSNVNPELVRINPTVEVGSPYSELDYGGDGFVTTLTTAFLYVALLACLIILITGFRRKDGDFRTQLWLVLIGMSFPVVGLGVSQFLGIEFANQRDTSPLLFVVSSAIIAQGVLRLRFFNILPLAREALFETLDDVLIILDNKDIIVDANLPARRLLSAAGPNPIGTHFGSIFPELFEKFENMAEIRTEIDGDDGLTYDLKITPLYDRSKQFIGRLINAHDISQQKNAESEIRATSKQNERRAVQFQAIANVVNAAATQQNEEETLAQVVQAISKQLGHYHVGIFLVDESKKYAILKATNSEGGQRMLERGHRLEVGETGIVGFVAVSGKPRIALDTGADAVYFNNPDLPETRSEVALPLVQGREIIGILDVQSTTPRAFTPDDIDTLSILASQVSITLQNTRLYEENIVALQNAEKAYRQLSGETWREALKVQTLKGFMYDGIRSEPLKQGSQLEHSLSIPVTIRGQNIGALKLESLDPDREWSEDELAMLTAAAEHAALALESARLLAESQKRAAKERVIGEITAKISAQSDVDELLKTAALELNRNLPGTEIAIQFNRDQETGNA